MKKMFNLLMIGLLCFSLVACGNSEIKKSSENIQPYLEYIGKTYRSTEKITLPSDLYDNMDNVEFMGMRGEISFGTKKTTTVTYKVRYCKWTSFEGFSEKEYQQIAKKLNKYFGCEAEVESQDYSTGHTYRYFWIDPNNDLHASFGHGLTMYHTDGSIEIIWADEFCEDAGFFGI